jgi:hypothetical protein
MVAGISGPQKARALKALVLIVFPRPPGAIRHLPQNH